MKKKSILLVFLLFAGVLVSAAGLTLDIGACVDRALKKNLELKQEEINLQAARRVTGQAWSNFLPDINVQTGLNFSDILFGNSMYASPNPLNFTAGLSFTLPLNTSVLYTIKQTKLSYEAKLINYTTAKNKITSQVTKAFYSLLAQQDNLTLLQDNIGLSKQQYEKVQTNFKHGLVSERMVLQSQLAMESTKLKYSQALIDYQKQKRDFLMLLGFESDEDAELSGNLDVQVVNIDPEQLIAKYLYQRTDIQAVRKNIDILKNSLQQTIIYRKTPSLTVAGGWTGTIRSPFYDNLRLGLNVAVPIDSLIPGSKDDQAVQSVRDELKKAELTMESTVNNAKLLIKNLAAGLKSAKDNIDLAKMQVKISQRYYQLAEEGFNQGTVERLELEQAGQDLLDAKQKLLSSQFQYKSILIDLMSALNISELKQLVEGDSAQ